MTFQFHIEFLNGDTKDGETRELCKFLASLDITEIRELRIKPSRNCFVVDSLRNLKRSEKYDAIILASAVLLMLIGFTLLLFAL